MGFFLRVLLLVHMVEVVEREGVRKAHEHLEEVPGGQGLGVCPIEVENQGLREVGHDLSYDLTTLNFATRTLTLVDSLDRRLEDLPHELVLLALL